MTDSSEDLIQIMLNETFSSPAEEEFGEFHDFFLEKCRRELQAEGFKCQFVKRSEQGYYHLILGRHDLMIPSNWSFFAQPSSIVRLSKEKDHEALYEILDLEKNGICELTFIIGQREIAYVVVREGERSLTNNTTLPIAV